MAEEWQKVGCARIAIPDLRVLADLRRRTDIRVLVEEDRAWVYWSPESHPMQQVLIGRLLPLPEVELFTRRGGYWYRLGEHLPAFEVPVEAGTEGAPLERIVMPRPMTALPPADGRPNPISLRVVRDERSRPRPPRALRCPLERLAAWAEQATSARLASLRGAWASGAGDESGGAEVLVLGASGSLPELPGALRFWGVDLLIPLGFRPDPELPESALCRAVGAGSNHLVILDSQGYELIDRAAFRPLSRAGVRLARRGATPARPGGGRP
jgi:hypothetical protein